MTLRYNPQGFKQGTLQAQKTGSSTMAEATQMIILPIPISSNLDDATSKDGKAWQEVLNFIKKQPGFQRVYWGRQVETPEKVQLHIVRQTLQQHMDFLASPSYKAFMKIINTLVSGQLTIRHGMIYEYSPACASLGKGSPVTGTAIYLATDSNWDAAWANWVSIVQHVPGFMGIAGGPIMETVDGQDKAFIALVGWESVEVHDAYHHTQHFWDRRRILLDPCKGYNYYGHIAFGGSDSDSRNAGQVKL